MYVGRSWVLCGLLPTLRHGFAALYPRKDTPRANTWLHSDVSWLIAPILPSFTRQVKVNLFVPFHLFPSVSSLDRKILTGAMFRWGLFASSSVVMTCGVPDVVLFDCETAGKQELSTGNPPSLGTQVHTIVLSKWRHPGFRFAAWPKKTGVLGPRELEPQGFGDVSSRMRR